MKLSGIMIGTENPSKLGEFYEQVFGPAGMREGDWYGFDLGGTYFMIGSHSEVHGLSKEPARMIVSLQSDDVAGDFEKVKSCGATVVAEPYQPNAENNPNTWLSTLADPDGNYIQIASPWNA
jgi:predicted enzyme related to lactoylglutathione lyase